MVNFNPSPWLAIVPIIIKIFARCEAAALTLAVSLTVFNSSSLLGQLRLLSTKNLFLFIDLTAKGISGILRLSKRGLFFSLERGGVLIISSELIHLLSLVTHGQVFIHFQNLLAFMLATCFVVLSKACQFFVNPQETLLLLDGFLLFFLHQQFDELFVSLGNFLELLFVCDGLFILKVKKLLEDLRVCTRGVRANEIAALGLRPCTTTADDPWQSTHITPAPYILPGTFPSQLAHPRWI
eukprot:m.234491 g.234491  ORF g.234491 m.234491 type:complete len:239 (+) comp54306_c0_seq4:523-1239(+)